MHRRKQTTLRKVSHFFLTKMVLGVGVIVALVAATEYLRSFLPATIVSDDAKEVIVGVIEVALSTAGYIVLFRLYDKRRIHELSSATFGRYAIIGSLAGVVMQALFIFVIWLAGTYVIINVNVVSTIVTPFAFALTAGFIAELIMIGVVFRLLEEQMGTVISLATFIILFTILHINIKGANLVSVGATAMQAGFMLPAAFVFSRSLWFPIFLHFGWDFAEPGIFGGINPSTSLTHGLFTSKITGNILVTGGTNGPQDSLSSLILCTLLGCVFVLVAKRNNSLIKPVWQTTTKGKVVTATVQD